MAFDKFINRHNGPTEKELPGMLKTIGVSSLDQLIEETDSSPSDEAQGRGPAEILLLDPDEDESHTQPDGEGVED